MTQTIAEQIKWDFEANGNLVIRDKNGKRIYYESSNGWWVKSEYDSKGNLIYYERQGGHWVKQEHDSRGNRIYIQNSSGVIIDNRPKPCSDKEIIIEGVKYKLVKA